MMRIKFLIHLLKLKRFKNTDKKIVSCKNHPTIQKKIKCCSPSTKNLIINIFCIVFSLCTSDSYSEWFKFYIAKKLVFNHLLEAYILYDCFYTSNHYVCRLNIGHRLVIMMVIHSRKWRLRHDRVCEKRLNIKC